MSTKVVLAASVSSMKSPSSLRLSGTNAIPARDRVGRRTDAAFLAVDADRASIDRVGAGDRPRELGPPAADESGEADDLSRADRERRRR